MTMVTMTTMIITTMGQILWLRWPYSGDNSIDGYSGGNVHNDTDVCGSRNGRY